MTRNLAAAALLLSLLSVAVACYDPPALPTQSSVGTNPPGGGNPPATTPSVPSPAAPYDPMVSSPFIVDTGATPSGRLAFTYSTDFWEHVISINSVFLDGTGFRQLSPSNLFWAWSPAWSPDGSLIAYATFGPGGESEIWAMRPDGSGNHMVAKGDYPFWLADGRIGYTCTPPDLCVVDASGANPAVLLARAIGGPEFGHTLSPDGSMIAFVRFVENESHVYSSVHYIISVMRRDGTGARRLTSTDSTIAVEGGPSWSPDGRQIAFTSERLGIAVADADGGRLHSVSRQGEISPSIGRGSPAWSHDGTQIIFGGERGIFFIANADGSGLIRRIRIPMPAGYSAGTVSWSNR